MTDLQSVALAIWLGRLELILHQFYTPADDLQYQYSEKWKIGYSQLAPHQDHIIQLYHTRKNFPDFLEKQLNYFKDKNIQI